MYYQGEPGAFSEAAIRHYFPHERAEGLPSFDAVCQRLGEEPDSLALLPIENAYRGPVTDVWDSLVAQEALFIWAEVVEPVHLALMALPGETLDKIERVRSHPQALMQSRGFWGPRGFVAEPALDTAGSARELAQHRWPGVAAIANPGAAERYGLHILAQPVEDYPDNRTRFWLVSQKQPAVPAHPILTWKATLAVDVAHRPGSLASLLTVFAEQGVNLTKIESRPRPGYPFEFRFWIDLALGEVKPDHLFAALEEVKSQVLFYRLLGYYPSLGD